MNVTEELLKNAHDLIKAEVSDEILIKLLEKLPNEQMMALALPMMGEALQDVPAETSSEKNSCYCP